MYSQWYHQRAEKSTFLALVLAHAPLALSAIILPQWSEYARGYSWACGTSSVALLGRVGAEPDLDGGEMSCPAVLGCPTPGTLSHRGPGVFEKVYFFRAGERYILEILSSWTAL